MAEREDTPEQVGWQYGVAKADGYVQFIAGSSHNKVRDLAQREDARFMRRRVTIGMWEEAP